MRYHTDWNAALDELDVVRHGLDPFWHVERHADLAQPDRVACRRSCRPPSSDPAIRTEIRIGLTLPPALSPAARVLLGTVRMTGCRKCPEGRVISHRIAPTTALRRWHRRTDRRLGATQVCRLCENDSEAGPAALRQLPVHSGAAASLRSLRRPRVPREPFIQPTRQR